MWFELLVDQSNVHLESENLYHSGRILDSFYSMYSTRRTSKDLKHLHTYEWENKKKKNASVNPTSSKFNIKVNLVEQRTPHEPRLTQLKRQKVTKIDNLFFPLSIGTWTRSLPHLHPNPSPLEPGLKVEAIRIEQFWDRIKHFHSFRKDVLALVIVSEAKIGR